MNDKMPIAIKKTCRYMYYGNSHLKENSHSIFKFTDYKAHLTSLTSLFDKVLYVGLNISIKIAGIKAEFDE